MCACVRVRYLGQIFFSVSLIFNFAYSFFEIQHLYILFSRTDEFCFLSFLCDFCYLGLRNSLPLRS